MEEKRISISEGLLKQLLAVVGTHRNDEVGDLVNAVRADGRIIEPQKKADNDGK